MTSSFLTFQKYNDIALARDIAELLGEHGITCVVEDDQRLFDPSYAFTNVHSDISVKIAPADFEKANKVLEAYYQEGLDNIEETYYLFSFTDQELIRILAEPDEWGHLDYLLAQKILKQRGKEIQEEQIIQLKERRSTQLKKPENVESVWIVIGYAAVLVSILLWYFPFVSFFPLVLGATIAKLKKTLPNGQSVPSFSEKSRKQGRELFYASLVVTLALVILRIYIIKR